MKIRHEEINIEAGSPFANCQLERKENAKVLTQLIESYKDGFVLAINNPWGTGKTTFIRMWEQHLRDKEFKSIYFNAWENDFESNPLVAIMSELKTIIGNAQAPSFETLLQKGALIAKDTIPTLLKALAKRYIDVDLVNDTIENLAKSAVDIFKEEVDEYAKKKSGLIEFRRELQKFIKKSNGDKPLVFIIDELDRCRPTYAVEILEQVKHFFSVPGIVFVLSIDKVQLGHAIRGYYGSENINSNEYLRRFIDIEYSIPAPNSALFLKYLYDYFSFEEFFKAEQRYKYQEFRDDGFIFLRFATLLFEKSSMTLRQQEKMFSLARVAIKAFNTNNYLLPSLFVLLIYIREYHSSLYNELQRSQKPTQQIINLLNEVFPQNIKEEDLETFVETEANLILLYNNAYSEGNRFSNRLYENINGSDNKKLLIKPCIDPDGINTLYFLQHRSHDYKNITIKHLLNKIDITNRFVF